MRSADRHALKRVLPLKNERAARDRQRRFWIDGVRMACRAVEHHAQVELVVRSKPLLTSSAGRHAVRALRERGAELLEVSPELFRSLQVAPRACGVGLVARQRWRELRSLEEGTWLVLERLRSPGNLGTLLRAAEASGARGLVCVGGQLDPFHPGVVRASMGSHFNLDFVRCGAGSLSRQTRRLGARLLGTCPSATLRWDQASYAEPLFIALGEEGEGMSRSLRASCTELVSIPVLGGADSLNVGVAGGLVLYEALRQRIP